MKSLWIFAIWLFFLSTSFGLNIPSTCIVNSTSPYRLPSSVAPISYHLFYNVPNFDPNGVHIFLGRIEIQVGILVSTSCIVVNCNSKTLTITNSTYTSSMYNSRTLSGQTSLDMNHDLAIFDFGQVLNAGDSGVFIISFNGSANEQSATGFFVSPADFDQVLGNQTINYKEALKKFYHHREESLNLMSENPNKKFDLPSQIKASSSIMYATQFEAIYARMAFPNFDEPEFKAYWQATITIPSSQTALFNTDLIYKQDNGDGTSTYQFRRTNQVMSSYLVAIALGQFDFVEAFQNNVIYRVYVPLGKAAQANFALDVVLKCTAFFETYFAFPYSNMNYKMDQIAVPAIQYNAMENWGLLTYFPGFLLVDPHSYTLEQIQLTTQVICHELAHQWTGDTVTLPWWSETYLNEGFARYLQYAGAIAIFPNWHLWTESSNSYYKSAYLPAMLMDYQGTFHAVVVPDSSVDGSFAQNQGMFDTITYGKGAAINRQFQIFLGDLWVQGLQRYILDNKFSNPTVEDLMSAFNEVGVPNSVTNGFDNWLRTPGFPIVFLQFNLDLKSLQLKQKPISPYLPNTNTIWFIPIDVIMTDLVSHQSYQFSFILNQTSSSFNTPININGPILIQANSNYTGYYIVAYELSLWALLLEVVSNPSFSIPTREIFVQTTFILVHMGHYSFNNYLELTQTLSFLTSNLQYASIWGVLLAGWQTFTISIQQTNSYPKFRKFVSDSLVPVLKSIGWNQTIDPSLSDIRQQVTFWSVYFNNSDAVQTALLLYDTRKFSDNIKPAIYFSAVQYGGVSRFNNVLNQFTNLSPSNPDWSIIGNALANGAPDSTSCEKVIQAVKKTNDINSLNFLTQMIQLNLPCRDQAFQAFQTVATPLLTSKNISGSQIASLLTNSFSSKNSLTQVTSWLSQNSNFIDSNSRFKILTSIQINIDFISNIP